VRADEVGCGRTNGPGFESAEQSDRDEVGLLGDASGWWDLVAGRVEAGSLDEVELDGPDCLRGGYVSLSSSSVALSCVLSWLLLGIASSSIEKTSLTRVGFRVGRGLGRDGPALFRAETACLFANEPDFFLDSGLLPTAGLRFLYVTVPAYNSSQRQFQNNHLNSRVLLH
jgi:hypothetical protein